MEAREDDARVGRGVRSRKSMARPVEGNGKVILPRAPLEPPVEPVEPPVVRALESVRMSPKARLDHGSAMSAGVVEGADPAVRPMHQDQRSPPEGDGLEPTRRIQLRNVADHVPQRPFEDALDLELEDGRVLHRPFRRFVEAGRPGSRVRGRA